MAAAAKIATPGQRYYHAVVQLFNRRMAMCLLLVLVTPYRVIEGTLITYRSRPTIGALGAGASAENLGRIDHSKQKKGKRTEIYVGLVDSTIKNHLYDISKFPIPGLEPR
jgi:hypothetical protein